MNASPFVNLNGKILQRDEANINLHSSAFRYGLGLFETMLVQNGRIRLGVHHLNRLKEGMLALNLAFPMHFSVEKLEQEIMATAAKNNLKTLARIRLQVDTKMDGIFTEPAAAQFLIECYPLEKSVLDLNTNGLVTGTFTQMKKQQDAIANFKTTNALIYTLAAQQATAEKWNDALITNASGHFIESSIANIFWVKNTVIYTPPLYEGCICGVMRSYLLKTLPGMGFNVKESFLTEENLKKADEVFLTNSIRGIKWVKQWENTFYRCHLVRNVAEKLAATFSENHSKNPAFTI